ncbi:hypothetical protein G9A89_015394 [Geosiphon pyriformis]|nr:hypothetical protein G9A89_015394 [Geosiphon pyriformis]
MSFNPNNNSNADSATKSQWGSAPGQSVTPSLGQSNAANNQTAQATTNSKLVWGYSAPFNAPAQQGPSTHLFGASDSSNATQSANTGIFSSKEGGFKPLGGGSSTFGSTGTTPSLFGSPVVNDGSLFGSQTNKGPSSFFPSQGSNTSAFGAPASNAPVAFGTPSTAAAASTTGAPSASGFGVPSATKSSLFGAQPTNSISGVPATTSSFFAQANKPSIGASGTSTLSFGAAASTSAPNLGFGFGKASTFPSTNTSNSTTTSTGTTGALAFPNAFGVSAQTSAGSSAFQSKFGASVAPTSTESSTFGTGSDFLGFGTLSKSDSSASTVPSVSKPESKPFTGFPVLSHPNQTTSKLSTNSSFGTLLNKQPSTDNNKDNTSFTSGVFNLASSSQNSAGFNSLAGLGNKPSSATTAGSSLGFSSFVSDQKTPFGAQTKDTAASTSVPPAPTAQKESIFSRLGVANGATSNTSSSNNLTFNKEAKAALPATTQVTASADPTKKPPSGLLTAPLIPSTTTATPFNITSTTQAGTTTVSSGLSNLIPTETTNKSGSTLPTIQTATSAAASTAAAILPAKTTAAAPTLTTTVTPSKVTAPSTPEVSTWLQNASISDMINRWSKDLTDCQRTFHNQAVEVAEWDLKVMENNGRVVNLVAQIEQANGIQREIEISLANFEQKQQEMEKLLQHYESRHYEAPKENKADKAREKTYKLAETINRDLVSMSQQLSTIITDINRNTSFGIDNVSNDPDNEGIMEDAEDDAVEEVVKILNAHLISLQWIDQTASQMSDRIRETQNALDTVRNRKAEERRSNFGS